MPMFLKALLFIVGALLAIFGGGCLILVGSLGGGSGPDIAVFLLGWLPLMAGGAMIFIAFYRSGAGNPKP